MNNSTKYRILNITQYPNYILKTIPSKKVKKVLVSKNLSFK